MSCVCRVCLAGGNVTLYPVEKKELAYVYEKITDSQFYPEDGRPVAVCCFCYRSLLRCWYLSAKACRSEKIFSDLFLKGLKATHETIENLNLETKRTLTVTSTQLIDLDDKASNNSSLIFIQEEPISVKEEKTLQDDTYSVDTVAPMQFVDMDDAKPNYGFPITLKKEPMSLKEEETVHVNELADTDSVDTVAPMQFIALDDTKPNYGCPITLKKEPMSPKEQKTVQVDELADTDSVYIDIPVSEESIKSQLIFEEDINEDNHFMKHSNAIDVEPLNLGTCTGRLESNQRKTKQIPQQKVEVNTGANCTSQYACTKCDEKFQLNSDLVVHQRIHNSTCSICHKQFNQASKLVRHMRSHTDEKPYACSLCDKQFKDTSSVVRHMRTHTGEKPYACSLCDVMQFKDKSSLVYHMKTHTGENPYTCRSCGKQFKQKIQFKQHINSHKEKTLSLLSNYRSALH